MNAEDIQRATKVRYKTIFTKFNVVTAKIFLTINAI